MQPLLTRQVAQRRAIANPHLVKDIGQMRPDGARRDLELDPDVLVAEALRHQSDNLEFTAGQTINAW